MVGIDAGIVGTDSEPPAKGEVENPQGRDDLRECKESRDATSRSGDHQAEAPSMAFASHDEEGNDSEHHGPRFASENR